MKILKNNYKIFIGIVIGFVLSGIGVYATTVIDSNLVNYKDNSGLGVDNVQAAIDGACSNISSIQDQINSMNSNIILREVTFPTIASLATTYDTNVITPFETISGYTPVFLVNIRTNSPGVAVENFGVSVSTNQVYVRLVRAGGSSTASFAPQATVVYFKDTMNYK